MPLRTRRRQQMRDLLYLSEAKMEVLTPQLPGRIRQRLGLEAGLDIGLVSVKATLPGNDQTPSVRALNAVAKMIGKKHGNRYRTDQGVTVGDWIQFEEEFRFGNAWPGTGHGCDRPTVEGLVYFAAEERQHFPAFALVGSAVHILDRRRSQVETNQESSQVGHLYVEAIRAYAHSLHGLPGHAATGNVPNLGAVDRALVAVATLCSIAPGEEGWTPPARLAGLARVLAVDDAGTILATPLYIEYAPRRRLQVAGR
ncbi:SAVMC3_10250 family protein [Streptomyces sp. NPDC002172]